MNRRWLSFPVLVLLLHAAVCAWVQGPFAIDDAYIAFRYARNWAEGLGPVYNVGEAVDGYTCFGWVAVLALVEALGGSVPVVSRLLQVAAGAALVGLLGTSVARKEGIWAGFCASMMLAVDGSFARWTQDGLETASFALLAFLGVRRLLDGERWAGLWLGAATLFRPEGALVAVVAVALCKQPGRVRTLVLFLAVVGPWEVWRSAYYGAPLPNTFYAKVDASGGQLARGAAYVATALLLHRLAGLMAVLHGCITDRLRGERAVFAGVSAALLLEALWVGGDWMGPGRFVVPALPFAYALVGGRLSSLAMSIAVVAQLVGSAGPEIYDLARERPHLESRYAVARGLASMVARDEAIVAGEVGQLGWETRMRILDWYGLLDRHVARGPFRGDKPGHQKWDREYMLGQNPEWVFSGEPVWPGYELVEVPLDVAIPLPEYRFVQRLETPAEME